MSKLNGRFVSVIAFSLMAWASATLFATDTRKVDATNTVTIPAAAMDEADRAWDAAEILRDRANPLLIPKGLFEGANAIVVIPNYVKGGLGIGGSYGKGVFARRNDCGQWLPPSYVRLTGGSLGFQLGVQATDLVLIFKDNKAADRLMKGRLKLGAEASAAAGPIGRDTQVGTIYFRNGVYSYSRSKGVFAGVALNGAVLTIDDGANRDAYGRYVYAQEIMNRGAVDVTDVVRPFMEALNEVSYGNTAGFSTSAANTNCATDISSNDHQ
jgi:lipid-binding SYLF domain-containing protein